MIGIYKITNNINNKVYIGKTNNSTRRWQDHQRLAITPNHKEYDKVLYKAMRKYGIENFSFEIIEEITKEEYPIISGDREKYWISYYDSYNNGYNESLGGDGGSTKGHCQGSANGRAKLTEEDVVFIRTKYAEGWSRKECYNLFRDKITEGSFGAVWQGKNWRHIMPEVYTAENKAKTLKRGLASGAKNKRMFNENEVKEIRKMFKEGMGITEISLKYPQASLGCIADLCHNRTYKEYL